jgi:hypothetical protein
LSVRLSAEAHQARPEMEAAGVLSAAQACGRYYSEAFILYVGAKVAAALDLRAYAHG